jgi:hypothetical protein
MHRAKIKFRGFSLQVNYIDRATAACPKLVRAFADRGRRVVSAKDPNGRYSRFSRRYFSIQVAH